VPSAGQVLLVTRGTKRTFRLPSIRSPALSGSAGRRCFRIDRAYYL